MTKAEKLIEFYTKCKKEGYTDMTDDTQSLKAKVIAADLKLPIGNIGELYRSAEKAYEADYQAKKEAAEKEAAEKARLAVDGELLFTMEGKVSGSKDATKRSLSVFRRADESIYTQWDGQGAKTEGVEITVQKGGTLSYDYHPSKLIYTGASSGGISMGGFHQTEAYTTERVQMSGKGDVLAISGGVKLQLERVVISPTVMQAFRRDNGALSSLVGKNSSIDCYDAAGRARGEARLKSHLEMTKNMADRNMFYQGAMMVASQVADEARLSMNQCTRIADVLNQILRHDYPPTDEEYYAKADKLSQGATSEEVKRAAEIFGLISDYRDARSRALADANRSAEMLQTEKEQAILRREADAKEAKKTAAVVLPVAAACIAVLVLLVTVILPKQKYKKAVALLEAGDYGAAYALLEGLGDSEAVAANRTEAWEKMNEAKYDEAEALLKAGDKTAAAMAFGKCADYRDARKRSFALWAQVTQREMISAGGAHTVGLKSDGTVVAVGMNDDGRCDVSDWTNIVAVSAGDAHTVGLKSDGTVVAVGNNEGGQCNVSDWRDIVAVSASARHTVGLKADGTVVAVGVNSDGRCNVSHWRDMVAVLAGGAHTVGLKSDGTVVAAGTNDDGRCDVSDWTNIVAVSAGSQTVGLKSDGTVVAVGENVYGECDVSGWTDIVAVSARFLHTVGLKSDGTVVAVGYNNRGQCNVTGWRSIVAVSAGVTHTVGLKSDGTAIAVGSSPYDDKCDVSDWSNIKLPEN